MTINRRQFLKVSASAAASTLLGRYEHIIHALKNPYVALAGKTLSADSAYDFFNLFEMVRGGFYWPMGAPTYQRDTWMLDGSPFSSDGLATYSQKALRKLYTDTVHSLYDDATLIPDILKYKDQIPDIIQLMEDNLGAITELEAPGQPEMVKFLMSDIKQGFSSFDKTMETLDHVLDVHKNMLSQIQAYLSPESWTMLSEQKFLRVIGTDIDIPYLFNLDEIKGVFEASWMDTNGTYAEILDISPEFRNILRMASQSEEARTKIAKHILQGYDPYFNLELADRHNLTTDDFTKGLKAALKDQMDRDLSYSKNDPETLSDRVADSGNDFANMEDDLAYVIALIEKRHLLIQQDDTTKDQPVYTFDFNGTSEDPRLCPEMDRIVDTFGALMNKTIFSLDRTNPAQISIQLNEETEERVGYMFEDYYKHALFVERTSDFIPLLSQPITKDFGFAEILADARKVWPQLRF